MRPIPLRHLPHTALIEQPDRSGRYGDAYQSPVEVSHVRYQAGRSLSATSWSEDAPESGLLFIDARNSSPALVPEVGARVTVSGNGLDVTATVSGVETCSGPYGVHHWEVTLR